MAPIPHPLSALSIEETNQARDVVRTLHPGAVLDFRAIYMLEPPKSEVLKFLALEHEGKVTESTPRPDRLAQLRYDVIEAGKEPEYHESVVDLRTNKRTHHEVVGSQHQASLTV